MKLGLRIPDKTFERWTRAAELVGASTVQDFVRESVERRIQTGALDTPSRLPRRIPVVHVPAEDAR